MPRFFASCPIGVSDLVEKELKDLGEFIEQVRQKQKGKKQRKAA